MRRFSERFVSGVGNALGTPLYLVVSSPHALHAARHMVEGTEANWLPSNEIAEESLKSC